MDADSTADKWTVGGAVAWLLERWVFSSNPYSPPAGKASHSRTLHIIVSLILPKTLHYSYSVAVRCQVSHFALGGVAFCVGGVAICVDRYFSTHARSTAALSSLEVVRERLRASQTSSETVSGRRSMLAGM